MKLSKNEIITELYSSQVIENILLKLTSGHELMIELKQELFLILCQMSEEKIQDSYYGKYINYTIINILKKQYHSSTSPFHKKFRKEKFEELFDTPQIISETDDLRDSMIEMIYWVVENKLSIVDRELFKLYYKRDRYDRWVGDLRDKTCERYISSYRKIEKKLAIKSINGQKNLTIDHSTIGLSINRSIDIIKKYMNDNGYDI
jgi:hypothetical protein